MFTLAGHLGMTVGELSERMDSSEFAEWVAMHRYYEQIPDLNRLLSMLISAVISGYCKRGQAPHPSKFMGLATPPKHQLQDQEALAALAAEMGQWQQFSD